MMVWTARYHDRSRFRMGVVSLMSGGKLADGIRQEGVALYELGQKRGRLTAAGLQGMSRAIREFSPSILQGHMFHANILTRLAGLIWRRILVVNTYHTGWEPGHRRALYLATDFLVDGSIVYGMPDDPEDVTGTSPVSSRRRIPYGIPQPDGTTDRPSARGRLGFPDGAPVWLAVGRLSAEKGFEDLVAAVQEVDSPQGRVMFVIVGEGEQEPRLRRQIARMELEGRVVLAGYQADLRDYLAAADYFVLPSRWEAGPLVVLEAMAAGLPVVATDVGQVRSMVADGESGIIVPPSEPGELGRAMNRLMAVGEAARGWGLRGRSTVAERYDFSRTCRATERYYLDLLARSDGSGDQ